MHFSLLRNKMETNAFATLLVGRGLYEVDHINMLTRVASFETIDYDADLWNKLPFKQQFPANEVQSVANDANFVPYG